MSESSSARDRGPVTAKGCVVRRKPLLCVTVSVVGADGTWEPQACRGSLQRHAVQVITALRRGRDLGDVAHVTRRHMVPGCSPVSGMRRLLRFLWRWSGMSRSRCPQCHVTQPSRLHESDLAATVCLVGPVT
uniref:Uncharacterized protein n=1 Tax=Rousettus aegyptiacus TaxID=9407 RepID=A0A7J8DIR1_ROUAE|nr:hypothetical protein HJG63_008702 [Rousettus aegyptiacus]